MIIGKLRQRLTIQRAEMARNEVGEYIPAWEDWATVWAAVEPASGKNYYAAKALNADVDGRVRIRYLDGLEPTMRIIHDGRILRIISILNPNEDKREIHIMYKEDLD